MDPHSAKKTSDSTTKRQRRKKASQTLKAMADEPEVDALAKKNESALKSQTKQTGDLPPHPTRKGGTSDNPSTRVRKVDASVADSDSKASVATSNGASSRLRKRRTGNSKDEKAPSSSSVTSNSDRATAADSARGESKHGRPAIRRKSGADTGRQGKVRRQPTLSEIQQFTPLERTLLGICFFCFSVLLAMVLPRVLRSTALQLGSKYQLEGRADVAVQLFRAALWLEELSRSARRGTRLQLADALRANNEVPKAIELLQDVLSDGAAPFKQANVRLGISLLALHPAAEAANSPAPPAEQELGRAEAVAAAIAQFEAALAVDPAYGEAHLYLGVALLQGGRVPEAQAHLRRVLDGPDAGDVAQAPYLTEAQWQLALSLDGEGRCEEALPLYTALLEGEPSPQLPYAQVQYRLAMCQLAVYPLPLAPAAGDFKLVDMADPEDAPTGDGEAAGEGDWALGEDRNQEMDGQRIEVEGEGAREQRGGDKSSRYSSEEEVVWHLKEVIRRDPSFVDAWIQLATVHNLKGRWELAVLFAQGALEVAPNEWGAHWALGVALHGGGRCAEALGAYAAVLELGPAWQPDVLLRAGICLHTERRYEEAIQRYVAILDREPASPRVHVNWGLALKASGHYEDAIQHFRTALHIDPAFTDAHIRWGNTRYEEARAAARHRKRKEGAELLREAIEHYEAALAVEPHIPGLRDRLAHLHNFVEAESK